MRLVAVALPPTGMPRLPPLVKVDHTRRLAPSAAPHAPQSQGFS